jgi:predicted dehydrogenase
MDKIHILGSGSAAKRHREAIERLPELYTISDYGDANIIDICTPNYLHFGPAIDMLIDGKDCIVEKPICANLEDFGVLVSTVRKYGRTIHPVMQYRHTPINSYQAVWNRPPSYYEGWRGKRSTALGGVIMSHGIHLIDHAIWRHGPATVVHCETWTDTRYDCDVETGAELSLSFRDGETLDFRFEIDPDMPQDAPSNPGYDDFFLRLGDITLESVRPVMEVIDQCYATVQGNPAKHRQPHSASLRP